MVKSELHLCNECAQGERFKQTENLLNYSMPSILGKDYWYISTFL